MSLYESVFIVRQDVSAQHVEGLVERYSEMIKENGGEVAKTEYWGLKNLAYRVKKNRKGHYMMFNIDAPSAAVDEFERNMRLSEDVLRYMTIRVDEFEEGPSAMMRNKGGREEGRRDDRDRYRGRDGGRDRPGGAPVASEDKPVATEDKPVASEDKPAEAETDSTAEVGAEAVASVNEETQS